MVEATVASTELTEQPAVSLPAIAPPRTAADYRLDSIGHALEAAYANASLLQLSADEAKQLAADFPDDAFRLGAGGDPDLIYIEHAYLRQRLNQVLGVGAAVPIRRREWKEEFSYFGKNYNNGGRSERKTAYRVYVDLVLVVRGCFVAEAIDDACYYPDNAKSTYSDALESAKSKALRRCCKEFGVGLQAWMKGWGEGWKERNPDGKPKAEPKPAKLTAESPATQQAKAEHGVVVFAPPRGWPDCEVHEFKLWIDSFQTSEEFKVAMGMFLGEPSIVGLPDDWQPILHHLRDVYKAKYAKVGTAELNGVIKAALDKLEFDRQSAAELDTQTMEAIAE